MPNTATLRLDVKNEYPASGGKGALSHAPAPLNLAIADLESTAFEIVGGSSVVYNFARQITTGDLLVEGVVQRHPQTGAAINARYFSGIVVTVKKTDPAATGGVGLAGPKACGLSIDDFSDLSGGAVAIVRESPTDEGSVVASETPLFDVTVPTGFTAQVLVLFKKP